MTGALHRPPLPSCPYRPFAASARRTLHDCLLFLPPLRRTLALSPPPLWPSPVVSSLVSRSCPRAHSPRRPRPRPSESHRSHQRAVQGCRRGSHCRRRRARRRPRRHPSPSLGGEDYVFSPDPPRALGLERPLLWPCPLSRAPHGARPMMRLALAEARRRAGLPRAASPSWSMSFPPRRRWQSSARGRFSRARVILPACRSSPSTIFPLVFLEV